MLRSHDTYVVPSAGGPPICIAKPGKPIMRPRGRLKSLPTRATKTTKFQVLAYQRPFCLPANYAVLQMPVQATLTAALVPFESSVLGLEAGTQLGLVYHESSVTTRKSHPDRPSLSIRPRTTATFLGPWRPTLSPHHPVHLYQDYRVS